MVQLAANPRNRWTRTQVEFYLDKKFHGALKRYFGEDGVRITSDAKDRIHRVSAPPLVDALAAIDALPDPSADDEEEREEPGARDRMNHESRMRFLGPETSGDMSPTGRMLAALRAEGRRVDREVPSRYRLRAGRCVGTVRGSFVYQFLWDREPEGFVPGVLKVDGKRVGAEVGRHDPARENAIELLVEKFVGDMVERATFLADPTYLLRTVHDRLLALKDEDPGPDAMLWKLSDWRTDRPMDASETAGDFGGLNPEQAAGVRAALSSPVSYLWGPPGTGKTRTIGALVRELRARRKRVLLISPYNVAVDEALLSVARGAPEQREGLVRLGRSAASVRALGLDVDSRLERMAVDSGLLAMAQGLVAATTASAQGQAVMTPSTVRECMDELGGWLVRFRGRKRADVVAVNRALARIRGAFRQPEGSIIAGADVLATTLTLRFLSPALSLLHFDHVVIDEGSVVRTPDVVLAATLNPDAKVTIAGDPHQLPAIVRERIPLTDQWLGRNPFALAGIREPKDAGGACVLLTAQHRMARRIREVVSEQFYKGILRDGAPDTVEGEVILIDSGGPECRSMVSMFGRRYSKANPHHRLLVAEALHTLRRREPGSRVLVLSPYAAQQRLYRKEASTALFGAFARFETIHAGQGSEQESVLIDLVLAGPSAGRSSKMLRDTANPYLANLLNVALSRAQRRLVIFADLDVVWTDLDDGVLAAVLRRVARVGRTIHLRDFPRPAVGVREALRGTTPQ